MKRFVLLVVFAAIASMAVPASAQDRYGSTVFSKESGGGYAWGMAWNYDSRSSARDRAIAGCRSRDGSNCREVGWFRNGCGALAISRNGYAAGSGGSMTAAKEDAVQKCVSAGDRGCRVVEVRCARSGSGGRAGQAGKR